MVVKVQRRSQAERREQTQQLILNCALELFAEQGFAATSVEQVVRRAGVSEGPVYHYYRNKKGLLMALCEGLEAELALRLERALGQGAEPDRLWRVFLEFCEEPGVAQLLLVDGPHELGRERWYGTAVAGVLDGYLARLPLPVELGQHRSLLLRMSMAAMAEAALAYAQGGDEDPEALMSLLLPVLEPVLGHEG